MGKLTGSVQLLGSSSEGGFESCSWFPMTTQKQYIDWFWIQNSSTVQLHSWEKRLRASGSGHAKFPASQEKTSKSGLFSGLRPCFGRGN